MHTLKVANYVLLGGVSEDFKPGRQPLRIVLRDCSKEATEKPGYIWVFSTKTR